METTHDFAFRIYVLLFFVFSLLVTFGWTSVRIYRQTGINPVTFDSSDSAHDLVGRLFKIVMALLTGVILCYTWAGHLYGYLLPAWYLELPLLQTVGVMLIHLSFLWIVTSQIQMGTSWRIGIDEHHQTTLVTKGVFAISRNPIFLGMLLSIVGIFLIIPNAFTLVILATGYVLIQVQVRLEEAYLERVHGEAYKTYRLSVHRWL